MSKPTRVPYVQGGKQGLKSPSGNPDRVANRGQGQGVGIKGVTTKAQVTSLKKGGSSAKSGGGKGPSGRS